jgi:hypothetical protein
MKRKEIATVIVVAVVAAVVSLVIAGALFNSPAKHTATAPNVQPISSTFPDVKNDPDYNFFNNNALDPTQPIQIGNSSNNSPFNGTSQ